MSNAGMRWLQRLFATLAIACLAQAPAARAQTDERSASDLSSQLAEFLARGSAEPIGRIDLPPLESLSADAAAPGVRAEFSLAAGRTVPGSNPVTLSLWRGGARLRLSVVNARVFVLRQIAVAARPLRSGATLGAADVALEQREVAEPRGDTLSSTAAVVGQRVRRHVGAGEAIRASWLDAAPLVERGERVMVRFARGPLRIETVGLAEESGVLGAWIRVRNLASKREVMGRVAESGVVHVEL
jgi:flagella basal body P-ring formation protein FlgA